MIESDNMLSWILKHDSTYVLIALIISLRMMLQKTIDELAFFNKVIHIGVVCLILIMAINIFDSSRDWNLKL